MRAFPTHTVLSRDDLRQIGCAGSTIARALKDGRLIRLRHGFYATPDHDETLQALAAARACPGAVISHQSAAIGRNLPIFGTKARMPELTVEPDNHSRVPEAHVYRASLPEHHIVPEAGARLTSVARTLVDLARHYSRDAAVVATDAALHRNLVEQDQIADVIRYCWNWPGIGRASRALALVDPKAESPLESLSRLAISDLGLPAPEPQLIIANKFGRFVGRVDFGWDDLGVVGEADGMGKYRSTLAEFEKSALGEEKIRQERLERLGLVVVRWGWADAVHQPERLRDRVLAGFDRAAQLRRSGFPPRWRVLR